MARWAGLFSLWGCSLFSLDDRTSFDWEAFEEAYDQFYQTGEPELLEWLLTQGAVVGREIIYGKWRSMPVAYQEDMLSEAVVETWELITNKTIVPTSQRPHGKRDGAKRFASLPFLRSCIARRLNRWVARQYDDVMVGLYGSRTPKFGSIFGPPSTDLLVAGWTEAKLLDRINYHEAIVVWIDAVSSIEDTFRVFGEALIIARFVLKFRVFFGYFPDESLLKVQWGKFTDAEWLISYVQIRWRINQIRMEAAGLWIPEGWRVVLDSGEVGDKEACYNLMEGIARLNNSMRVGWSPAASNTPSWVVG